MSDEGRGLRASAAGTASLAVVAVAVAAIALHAVVPTSDWYVVKATAAFAIVMAAAMMSIEAHHPFATYGPANQITTARVAVVALVTALIGEPATTESAMFAVAASILVTILDGVDGRLARRTGIESAFGARFDMETDAALILVLAVLAWQYGKAGAWVVLSGLLRYLFIAAGWCWAWMRAPLPSSFRGKLICVVQIVILIVVLAPFVRPPLSVVLSALGLAALFYSFLVDTLSLWRRARVQQARAPRTP